MDLVLTSKTLQTFKVLNWRHLGSVEAGQWVTSPAAVDGD